MNTNPKSRLNYIIDTAWDIFFQRVVNNCLVVNKESSMQLHLSKIINDLGDVFCIFPGEIFNIELESKYDRKNIDITCSLSNIKAAIELKCFRKSSNLASDIDMYDVLADIERLDKFEGFHIKKFICLTDHSYYVKTTPTKYAFTVKLTDGTHYSANNEIIPGWQGKWKVGRDKPIILNKDLKTKWIEQSGWYYLKVDR